MKEENLIVIPYLASGAQGDELTLSVTGWRRHFKEPYRIAVVGDWHPVVESGEDITFISCPRIDPVPGQYLPHLDMVHKFRKAREHFPESSGFIYTCDDIYATADITMEDIIAPKRPEQGFFFVVEDWRKEKSGWLSDKLKTGALCLKEGIPVRNWVCHLPVYYRWDMLFGIYDRYGCDHESYIVENIYFNIRYPGDPGAVDCRAYRDEVKTSRPDVRPVGSVKWISNANCGWSPELEALLRTHYGLM